MEKMGESGMKSRNEPNQHSPGTQTGQISQAEGDERQIIGFGTEASGSIRESETKRFILTLSTRKVRFSTGQGTKEKRFSYEFLFKIA